MSDIEKTVTRFGAALLDELNGEPDSKLITMNDLCERFGTSRPTLYRKYKEGDAPERFRWGNQWRTTVGAVRRYISAKMGEADNG